MPSPRNVKALQAASCRQSMPNLLGLSKHFRRPELKIAVARMPPTSPKRPSCGPGSRHFLTVLVSALANFLSRILLGGAQRLFVYVCNFLKKAYTKQCLAHEQRQRRYSLLTQSHSVRYSINS
ncbi:unnamed protein product [Ixodes persulcatus]